MGWSRSLARSGAGKVRVGHVRLAGQDVHGDRLAGGCASAQAMCRAIRSSPGSAGHRRLDELGLPAVAVRRDDQPARDGVGDAGAVVPADEVHAQVEAGGAARAGQHVALVDVEDVGVDPDAAGSGGAAGRRSASGWWPGGRRAVRRPPARTRRSRWRRCGHPARAPAAAPRSAPGGIAGHVGDAGDDDRVGRREDLQAVRRCSGSRRRRRAPGPARWAHTVSSYQGTSSSGRGRPNTSVTMPSSKADMPS